MVNTVHWQTKSNAKTLIALEDHDVDLRNIDSWTIAGERSVAFADGSHFISRDPDSRRRLLCHICYFPIFMSLGKKLAK